MPKNSGKFHLQITLRKKRILDISEDLCDQMIKQLNISRSALQVDEEIEVVKDAYLITYVLCA
jgi:hypothetical protein